VTVSSLLTQVITIEEMSLEDILSSSIVKWINRMDFDLESTWASTGEVAVSPKVLPAVCAAMIETTRCQLKNASRPYGLC